MDGLLVVDKPRGLTSHDVVARLRRALGERRIGHTGTLDPMATGVLVLVLGKATRLARFLSTDDKSYDAVVRFGFATDTADATGRPLGAAGDRPTPSREAIEAALDAFRGTFLQQPPAFSAKKIDGQRSYTLARKARASHLAPRTPHPAPEASHPAPRTPRPAPVDPPALPAPCRVTTTRLEILAVEADTVTLRVDCSAGFYVRSLAHDLGERLGVGAHLTALRRTRTGDVGLDRALPLETAERDPRAAAAALVPLADALPSWPAVVLTAEGARRVAHGQDVRPIDHASTLNSQSSAIVPEPSAISPQPLTKLLSPSGELVAVAETVGAGVLHPSVVLV